MYIYISYNNRAARRWNLQTDDFELQDEYYKSFEKKQSIYSTVERSGTKVIRLVKKVKGG